MTLRWPSGGHCRGGGLFLIASGILDYSTLNRGLGMDILQSVFGAVVGRL